MTEKQKTGEDPIFEMDGTEHYLESATSCCSNFGQQCSCNGFMHYQPVYGGYYYKCELCGKTQ